MARSLWWISIPLTLATTGSLAASWAASGAADAISSARAATRMPARRGAGNPARKAIVVMALSLERKWSANGADGGGLVTQQPWLCNGGPGERLNVRVMAHDPEKWQPVFGK